MAASEISGDTGAAVAAASRMTNSADVMNSPDETNSAAVANSDIELQDRLRSLVRDVPDWPAPGVRFKDLTAVFEDPRAFADTVAAMAVPARVRPVDAVVGIEARGFILGAPIAVALGVGFVALRKKGKLPNRTVSESYALEYGTAVIEMHSDALAPGDRVLLVDDVLATGGTLAAAIRLIRSSQAEVVAVSVLMELGFLHGRERLEGVDLSVILQS